MFDAQKHWEDHRGENFDIGMKLMKLVPSLQAFDQTHDLGDVIFDCGAGVFSISTYLKRHDRKRVAIDLYELRSNDEVLSVKLDLENLLSPPTREVKQVCAKIRQFTGRTETIEQADTLIFSEVLNYIDFERVLKTAKKYLRPGGYIVIINMAGRGDEDAFSEKKPENNAHLKSVVESLFTIKEEVFYSQTQGESGLVMTIASNTNNPACFDCAPLNR